MMYNKEIAEKYSYLYETPIKKYVIRPSILSAIGDLNGRDILDIGCGNGEFTRLMKLQGAKGCVGFDSSEFQIEIAQKREVTDPLGIHYQLGDAKNIEKLGEFDIVTAIFVLHYSFNRSELLNMCKRAYRNLADSGTKFIALNENPEGEFNKEFYGVIREAKLPIQEGYPVRITLKNGEHSVQLINYLYSKQFYEDVLREAGFKQIMWHSLKVSTDGINNHDASYWKEFDSVSKHYGLFEAKF